MDPFLFFLFSLVKYLVITVFTLFGTKRMLKKMSATTFISPQKSEQGKGLFFENGIQMYSAAAEVFLRVLSFGGCNTCHWRRGRSKRGFINLFFSSAHAKTRAATFSREKKIDRYRERWISKIYLFAVGCRGGCLLPFCQLSVRPSCGGPKIFLCLGDRSSWSLAALRDFWKRRARNGHNRIFFLLLLFWHLCGGNPSVGGGFYFFKSRGPLENTLSFFVAFFLSGRTR